MVGADTPTAIRTTRSAMAKARILTTVPTQAALH